MNENDEACVAIAAVIAACISAIAFVTAVCGFVLGSMQ
jgi:hypothetical protein